MSILTPDLTAEVYNADYRVLSQIPWQEAIRLILRGAVVSSTCTAPRCTYTVRHWLSSIRCQWRCANTCMSPTRRSIGSPATGCFAATDTAVPPLRRARRHRGSRSAALPGRRRHLVQPGGRVPALQRSQGGPDAAGSRDEDDPRAIRTEAARQVSLCGVAKLMPALHSPGSVNR
jgi:hypothetical protein